MEIPDKGNFTSHVFLLGSVLDLPARCSFLEITWERPQYGSNFHIHNYTVERRKEHAKSFTVVATLPYTQTGMVMEDLEPATEYTIRMSSNNEYGRSEDGESLTLSTSPSKCPYK